ncbi:MAG: S-adenosylmethionine:tRNA ribosyltransferase-isomerase, partial [Bryobacteraceae bacterium]
MLVDEFDYELPSEQIARAAASCRVRCWLCIATRRWEDRAFRDFPHYLNTGDCLIVNESKVFPSRLYGQRGSGVAQIEVFLIKPLDAHERTWQALVRPGRKVKVGQRIVFSETLAGEVLERKDHGLRVLRFETDDVIAALEAIGHVPLPPYIRREDTKQDRER